MIAGVGAAFLSAGIASAQTSVCDQPSPIPCVTDDPNSELPLCPDLIVDRDYAADWFVENKRFNKRHCSVAEGEVVTYGVRTLLRFTSATPNLGPGELVIGNPLEHPEWFDLETCHRHEHLKDYTDYRLWSVQGYNDWQALRAANPGACPGDLLASNSAIAAQMVAGRKQGFCVIDLDVYQKGVCEGTPFGFPNYFDCGAQGLSVCWVDYYDPLLDGQWIDVTDLPDGDYVLEIEVNAERLFTETNYDNNAAAIPVTVVKPVRRGGGHR